MPSPFPGRKNNSSRSPCSHLISLHFQPLSVHYLLWTDWNTCRSSNKQWHLTNRKTFLDIGTNLLMESKSTWFSKDIQARRVYVHKAQSIYLEMGKISTTRCCAFIALIQALKFKIDLFKFQYWISEGLNFLLEVSAWLLISLLSYW